MLYDLIIDGMVIENIETDQPYSDAQELLKREYLPLLAKNPQAGEQPELMARKGARTGTAFAVRWDNVRTIEVRVKR